MTDHPTLSELVAQELEEAEKEAAEKEYPLNAYPLYKPYYQRAFLLRLIEIGEEGLLAATSHVWHSLEEPVEYRATLMGKAAGTGGKGKIAIWNMLARMLQDVEEIDTPDLPRSRDFEDPEDWHRAVFAHFEAIEEAVRAILDKYTAILGG